MASDQIVKSFLILFFVGCIVEYGSCAPIEEKIVLDNGTVLTMVIHEVQKAPPPRYDSALDANTKDEDKPNIVIQEVQYAPPPRVMSKRDADEGDKQQEMKIDLPQTPPPPRMESNEEETEISQAETNPPNVAEDGQEMKIDLPQTPPPPRMESNEEETEISQAETNPPNVAEDGGVETTEETVQKQDSNANENNVKSQTEKVSELPKSVTEKNDVGQSDDDAGHKRVEDGDGKERERTTIIAIPTEPIIEVHGSENSGSKDGSNTQGDTNANDDTVTDGNVVDDHNAKNGGKVSGESNDNTSTGENEDQKSSTENDEDESNGEIERKPPGDIDPNNGNIYKPTFSIPSDEGIDEDDDEHIDDNSNLNANDNGKVNNGEDAQDFDGDDDDTDSIPNVVENAAADENEEWNEDDDDDDDDDRELNEDDSKRKPAISGETDNEPERKGASEKDVTESQSSGHFMSYFLISVVFVACFYLVFHNRQKIKAYVLEGKTGRGRRRKAGNSEYRQLSTAEEVLPSADKGIEPKMTYTY